MISQSTFFYFFLLYQCEFAQLGTTASGNFLLGKKEREIDRKRSEREVGERDRREREREREIGEGGERERETTNDRLREQPKSLKKT
jgi:hypothetical protein